MPNLFILHFYIKVFILNIKLLFFEKQTGIHGVEKVKFYFGGRK